MSSQAPARMFTILLREVCKERGITVTGFSSDWVFCLQREGKTAYVFGYDFPLNTATAQQIAKDKAATADLLAFHQLPHVEHRLVTTPLLPAYVPPGGNWPDLTAYFERHGHDVVCKPNDGTGGGDVFRARTPVELESAIHRLLQRRRSCCVSPYLNISEEYRVILVDRTPEVVYRKRRQAIAADGLRTVRDILLESLRVGQNSVLAAEMLSGSAGHVDLDVVMPAGKTIPLDWRHNLGLGATPELQEEGTPLWTGLTNLARSAATAVGISTASIDVVDVDGSLLVLEINSGIMMETFALVSEEYWRIAHRVYDRIIAAMFDGAVS